MFIEILTFSFMKMCLKVSSAKWCQVSFVHADDLVPLEAWASPDSDYQVVTRPQLGIGLL